LTVEDIQFSSLFTPAQVVCLLENMTCRDVFKRLIELLGEVNHSIDIDRVYAQILRRDSCGITLASPEVAVVHVRVEGLEQLRIAIATSRQGSRCAAALEGGTCAAAEVRATASLCSKHVLHAFLIFDFSKRPSTTDSVEKVAYLENTRF